MHRACLILNRQEGMQLCLTATTVLLLTAGFWEQHMAIGLLCYASLQVCEALMLARLCPLQALKALRIMNEQLYYGRCNSSTTTDGVHVDATSAFSRVSAINMPQGAHAPGYK